MEPMNIDAQPCEQELARTRHYLELTRRQRDAIRRDLKDCEQALKKLHFRDVEEREEQMRREAVERSRREAEEQRTRRRREQAEEQMRREAVERSRREAEEQRARSRREAEEQRARSRREKEEVRMREEAAAAKRYEKDKEEAKYYADASKIPTQPSITELRKNLYSKHAGTLDHDVIKELAAREGSVRTDPRIPAEEIKAFIDAYAEIIVAYLSAGVTPPEYLVNFLEAARYSYYAAEAQNALDMVAAQAQTMQQRKNTEAAELEQCNELMCKYGIFGRKDVKIVSSIKESNNPDRGAVVSCFQNKRYCTNRAYMASGSKLSTIAAAKQDLENYSDAELRVLAKQCGIPENIPKNDLCWLLATFIHNEATRNLE